MPSPARVLLVATSAFAAGMAFGAAPSALGTEADATYASLGVFARALHYIGSSWVGEIDDEQLLHGAIKGMVALLDRHSRYFDPKEFEAARREPGDEAAWIGLDLEGSPVVRVAGVLPFAPAARAGVRVGDLLLEIDGTPTTSLPLEQVKARLRGQAGTQVVLVLSRPDRPRPEQLVLLREVVREPTVHSRPLPDGFGYLAIARFADDTLEEVTGALVALGRSRSLRGLVLDLRGNPGGLLEQAVRVADLWIESGVIVTTRSRAREPEVQRAHPLGTEPPYPMVVLIDGKTASAAEVLAAALQDHRRAWLVGARTFGKASVQTVVELEDRSALKLTVARYLTPSGRFLEGDGLNPDQALEAASPSAGGGVGRPDTSSDPGVRAAVSVLSSRAIGGTSEGVHPRSGTPRSGSFTGPKGRVISKP